MENTQSKPSRNSNNIFECPETFAKWYCLNGGTCFTVKIIDSSLHNCWCANGFQGARCDYKYVERNDHQTKTANLSEVDQNQLTVTFTSTNADIKVNNLGKPELVTVRRQQDYKQLHLSIYDLIVILIAILLMLIVFRFVRKKGGRNQQETIERSSCEQDLRGLPLYIEQVTNENASISLDLMYDQDQAISQYTVPPSKGVIVRDQQQKQLQTHHPSNPVTFDHQQR